MARDYNSISVVLNSQGNQDQALRYHNKALAIHEQLQDKIGMGSDYGNIGIVLTNIKDRNEAIKSFSKGLEILKEHEQKTGYHHPLIDMIAGNILRLQQEK